ncbi:MAG: hypothetical protein J6Z11_17255 [Candidatus Riflebacteria bacterium]|nr:hypothetical protein [Candidatus Riflebacteria bacterium]
MTNWKIAAYMHSSGISVRKWAIANNTSYHNIREHILAGMTPDEACEYAKSRRGRHDTKNKYYINGELLIDYCRKNNLHYNTISDRCRKGLTPEEAVTLPVKGRKDNARERRNYT